jgi:hypothetical protein
VYKYIFIFLFIFLTSCIVQSPKYTTIGKVMSLKLGMTKAEVEEILDLSPYDLKAYTDTSSVYTYVYRNYDRRTFLFFTKPKNGKKAIGRYIQLHVAYSIKDHKVINIESCSTCPDNLVSMNRINFDKVVGFITITLPVILVYIGLKN